MSELQNISVTNFLEYLRIKTVQPNPDYDSAITFLSSIGQELGLDAKIIQVTESHPMLLLTWTGSDPNLRTVLLSSHMDVVPVFEEHWKFDPFGGIKDENGEIYGRGTQDMKSVSIQYLEAIRNMKKSKFTPLRTIHLIFTTDEEIGSFNGMQKFTEFKEFHDLHIGCTLDEGLASPTDEFVIYNGEKKNFSFVVTCKGNPGHGSQLIENTAGEKMRKVIDKVMDLREQEKLKLKNGSSQLKDIIVLNFTMIVGSPQLNVVPSEMTAHFDMRVPPNYKKSDVDSVLNNLLPDDDVTWRYYYDDHNFAGGSASVSETDPWWKAIKTSFDKSNIKYRVDTFPAATDSRFIRCFDIPAYGFSPMNNTPILLHDHNEKLHEDVFVKGIDIYSSLIRNLASVPGI